MRVHHLNCATLCPRFSRWLFRGAPPHHHHMVCHCLLIETDEGLVLVDTGFGTDDIAHPRRRLGAMMHFVLAPDFDPRETAVAQIEALGFRADDVRHIVVTHLDLDHAGGLGDFPNATVHLLRDEHTAAFDGTWFERTVRYHHEQWAHGPVWKLYAEAGERWFGFDAVRGLDGLPPELLLVPLRGHSAGHTGVAVDTGAGWLLHCGDAYFHASEKHDATQCPPGLRAFQTLVQRDAGPRHANQARLRALVAEHGSEVTVFCAHDAAEFEALAKVS
ncbi:MAG: MBL fold metallo-hydrolase [Myxococcales bacterium]|nr:MBL fold metallo-hydrolase [Myxococcales bacterium]